MKKNEILENIHIDKLIFGGKGLAVAPDGRKIIITGGVIPGSVVNLRILKVKKGYFEAQLLDTVKKSPLEQELPAHYQVYGGCKWLPISYPEQLKIKTEQVREAFHYVEKYWSKPPVPATPRPMDTPLIMGAEEQDTTTPLTRGDEGGFLGTEEEIPRFEAPVIVLREPPVFHPIVPSPEIYGYRNKVEFLGEIYLSKRRYSGYFPFRIPCSGTVRSYHRLGFLCPRRRGNQCDFQGNEYLLKEVWTPTYDPKTNIGFWRHFVVRKAHFTGEIMLILSVNHEFEEYSRKYEGDILIFVGKLMEQFPAIASVYLLQNSGRADIVTGEAILMKGKATITEKLLGKTFEINPKSFFQTNSLGAEKLYTVVRDLMKTKGGILLDLYAGTGTIGILMADRFEHVYSVELVAEASKDGAKNATKNGVSNITFINEKTEKFLPKFLIENQTTPLIRGDEGGLGGTEVSHPKPPGFQPSPLSGGQDTQRTSFSEVSLIIDPPRDGMHPDALPDILKFNAKEIIYVSCNPATLARDLDYILANSTYRLTDIVPVDMFPHTHHIETVVRLEK